MSIKKSLLIATVLSVGITGFNAGNADARDGNTEVRRSANPDVIIDMSALNELNAEPVKKTKKKKSRAKLSVTANEGMVPVSNTPPTTVATTTAGNAPAVTYTGSTRVVTRAQQPQSPKINIVNYRSPMASSNSVELNAVGSTTPPMNSAAPAPSIPMPQMPQLNVKSDAPVPQIVPAQPQPAPPKTVSMKKITPPAPTAPAPEIPAVPRSLSEVAPTKHAMPPKVSDIEMPAPPPLPKPEKKAEVKPPKAPEIELPAPPPLPKPEKKAEVKAPKVPEILTPPAPPAPPIADAAPKKRIYSMPLGEEPAMKPPAPSEAAFMPPPPPPPPASKAAKLAEIKTPPVPLAAKPAAIPELPPVKKVEPAVVKKASEPAPLAPPKATQLTPPPAPPAKAPNNSPMVLKPAMPTPPPGVVPLAPPGQVTPTTTPGISAPKDSTATGNAAKTAALPVLPPAPPAIAPAKTLPQLPVTAPAAPAPAPLMPAPPAPPPPPPPGAPAAMNVPPVIAPAPGFAQPPMMPSADPDSAAQPRQLLKDVTKPPVSAVANSPTELPAVTPSFSAADASMIYGEAETDLPLAEQSKLQALADRLSADKSLTLNIVSYASGTSDQAGQSTRTSLARGLAVRRFFLDRNIPRERINVRPLGNKADAGVPDRVDLFLDKASKG